jgi:hypothetical protein
MKIDFLVILACAVACLVEQQSVISKLNSSAGWRGQETAPRFPLSAFTAFPGEYSIIGWKEHFPTNGLQSAAFDSLMTGTPASFSEKPTD